MKCRKYLSAEDGFTLLEVLLTLTLVCFLVLIPYVSFQDVREQLALDYFFEELETEMKSHQNHAILTEEWTSVEFIPSHRLIRFKTRGAVDKKLALPESVQRIYGGIREHRFEPYTGNLGKFDPVAFETTRGRYKLIFQLGSGKFYVKKE